MNISFAKLRFDLSSVPRLPVDPAWEVIANQQLLAACLNTSCRCMSVRSIVVNTDGAFRTLFTGGGAAASVSRFSAAWQSHRVVSRDRKPCLTQKRAANQFPDGRSSVLYSFWSKHLSRIAEDVYHLTLASFSLLFFSFAETTPWHRVQQLFLCTAYRLHWCAPDKVFVLCAESQKAGSRQTGVFFCNTAHVHDESSPSAAALVAVFHWYVEVL